jgi:hypothetical protein
MNERNESNGAKVIVCGNSLTPSKASRLRQFRNDYHHYRYYCGRWESFWSAWRRPHAWFYYGDSPTVGVGTWSVNPDAGWEHGPWEWSDPYTADEVHPSPESIAKAFKLDEEMRKRRAQ